MKRRNFIKLSLLTPLVLKLNANSLNPIEPIELATIDAITNIIFPKSDKFDSSKELHTISYIVDAISQPYFDKDKKIFLINGIKEFYSLYPNFIKENTISQNNILNDINKTSYGNSWLDFLIYLTIEANFGDSIYGGNFKLKCWDDYNYTPALPRPKQKYGKQNDL